jgi:hypothetical protein
MTTANCGGTGFFIFVYKVEKERDRLKYILELISIYSILGLQ